MKRAYRVFCAAAGLVLMASAAMPQVRTKPGEKAQSSATPAVTGTGTPGQLVKWAGADGSVLGNSIITETKLGNIGIGTTAPGSKLSVQGMIETTLGGYKFPDGTIQTTAVSGKVAHDDTLQGDGTAGSPLGMAVPLSLAGIVPEIPLFTVTNAGAGGRGILVVGGNGDPSHSGGIALFVQGGNSEKSDAGIGLFGVGGKGIDHDGGAGGQLIGGAGVNGSGGEGLRVTGGPSLGAGHQGGAALIAQGGDAGNGAKVGLAGDFRGDVAISGTLSKGAGSFKIDHPLDPENKYLYHSFVESPDMKNIYDGTVTTDANGDATVTMPDWFEALNQDFRYQVSVIGTFAQAIVAQEINGNSFTIKTNAPNIKVSWQVTGTRHDAYANKHRIPVEELKPADERGLFLHPDAFDQPEDRGVQFVKNADRLKSTRQRAVHP